MSLTIHPADRDAIYVLATDPEAPEVAPLLAPHRLNGHAGKTVAHLLALPPEAAAQVELINPADLEGVGLTHYLTEGLGLAERHIAPDRAALDALQSPVIVLHGRLAEGGETDVILPPGVSLAGRYMLPRSPIGLAQMPAAAAHGAVPPMTGPVPAHAAGRRGLAAILISAVIGLALLVAIGLWLA